MLVGTSSRIDLILVVSVLFFSANSAMGLDTTWTGGTGNWSTAANWSDGEPASNLNAYINNGGTVQITDAGEECYFLYMGEGPTESGLISMASGELSIPWMARVYVGYSGAGTFTQSGGTFDASDEFFYLAYNTDSSGSYFLSGAGQLLTDYMYVGWEGEGEFEQTGGTHTVAAVLFLGSRSGADGTYNLSGSAQLSAGSEFAGQSGTGTFTQSGGTNTITGSLYVGSHDGGSGSYELTGTGQLSASWQRIGDNGTGSFTHIGGTNTITNTLHLGVGPTGDGTYELSGGSVSAGNSHVGHEGTGTFTHSAGTCTVTGGLNLGFSSDGDGTYELTSTGELAAGALVVGYSGTGGFTQTGGTSTVSGGVKLGNEAGATGTYNLSGTGTLSAGSEYCGYNGTGSFIHSSGTNTITDGLSVGYDNGDGSYNLSGTGEVSADWARIGEFGVGTFTQSGGTNTITGFLNLGYASSADGTYDLQDGVLTASAILVGVSGQGQITQSDGSLTASSYLGLGIGATGSGTWQLDGGTAVLNHLYVGRIGAGEVNWTAGSLDANRVDVNSTGTMTVSHDWTFDADLNIDGGTLDLGPHRLTLDAPGTAATGELLAGSLINGLLTIGEFANGTFTQSGGTNAVSGFLRLGNESSANGTYDLQDGVLTASAILVGVNGRGQLTQNDGDLTAVSYLALGQGTGPGTWQFDGGTAVLNHLYVGRTGTGEMNWTAGSLDANRIDVNSTGTMNVSQDWTFDADLNIDGGTLDLGTYRLTLDAPGAAATGELLAGSLINGQLTVGESANATFTQSAGTCRLIDDAPHRSLVIANQAGSTGTYSLSGTADLNTDSAWVGYSGNGTFSHLAGTHTVDGIVYIGSLSTSTGDYVLSSGAQFTGSIYVAMNGVGTFQHNGGTVDARWLVIGGDDGGTGTYTISDGQLTAEVLRIAVILDGVGTLEITSTSPSITVSSWMVLGFKSRIDAVPGSTIHMTGTDFEILSSDPTNTGLADLVDVTFIFEGGAADVDSFEVASDVDDDFAENFAFGSVVLGGTDIGQIELVDDQDNGNRGASGREALFALSLNINTGSSLELNEFTLCVAGDVAATLEGWVTDGRLFSTSGPVDVLYDADRNRTCATPCLEPVPIVTAGPETISVFEGALATFTVTATGDDLEYQWQQDAEPLDNGETATGSFISGADTDTLQITGVGCGDLGLYDVVVRNTCGRVTSPIASLGATTSTCPWETEEGKTNTYVVTGDGTGVPWSWKIEPLDPADFNATPFVDINPGVIGPALDVATTFASSINFHAIIHGCSADALMARADSVFGDVSLSITTGCDASFRLFVGPMGCEPFCAEACEVDEGPAPGLPACTFNPGIRQVLLPGIDCNGNGLDDYLDLSTGASADADQNNVPDECDTCRADFDVDGAVDADDIRPFIGCIAGPDAELQPGCVLADFDGDGHADLVDIARFQQSMGSQCP